MKKISKFLLKYKIIMISISIFIISLIYIKVKISLKPHLIINGYSLSVNENKMYIDGAVSVPGVYIFKDGDKLKDIINAAGGLKSSADLDSIDLEYRLRPGEKITIKYIKEDGYDEDEEEYGDLIDINEASKEELMSIDGIGEKMAENIIEYRSKNRFECIEDIMNVSGIGEKKFSNIKAKIIVK